MISSILHTAKTYPEHSSIEIGNENTIDQETDGAVNGRRSPFTCR